MSVESLYRLCRDFEAVMKGTMAGIGYNFFAHPPKTAVNVTATQANVVNAAIIFSLLRNGGNDTRWLTLYSLGFVAGTFVEATIHTVRVSRP